MVLPSIQLYGGKMANKRFEILEKKVELLIKTSRQRLSLPQFNALLAEIIGEEEIVEESDEE